MRRQLRFHAVVLSLVCIACLITTAVTAHSAQPPVTVLSVLRDYSKQTPSTPVPAIVLWSWPEDVKKQAVTFSQSQIIDHEGTRSLSINVTEQVPWGVSESLRAMPIGPDLLPPTADAVVIKLRVLEGKVTLSLGGPTIYFGHSDVQTMPVTLSAEQGTGWREITVSLHDGLIRNFRRAGFGRASPVIYYTRWIQEPMGLYVHRGSVGRVLIESITLISQGRGKAERAFEAGEKKLEQTISDFTEPASLKQVFTASHESADFQAPAKLSRPNWTPPKLSHDMSDDSAKHQGVLRVVHRGAEEVTFAGIKLSNPDLRERNTNSIPSQPEPNVLDAIAVDLRVTSPLPIEQVSIDWLLYESPVDAPLDFERCQPPVEWRDKPDRAFDFYLTEKLLQGQSYAMHHARRALPNGQWTRVILPLSDFVCVLSSGTLADKQAKQLSPQRDTATALCFTPSFRQHRQPTTIEIDRIQWVRRSSSEPASFRTFPQVDPARVRLVPFGEGVLRQMLPAE
jgi:hypothetical protein